jgi:hypothetical protein
MTTTQHTASVMTTTHINESLTFWYGVDPQAYRQAQLQDDLDERNEERAQELRETAERNAS